MNLFLNSLSYMILSSYFMKSTLRIVVLIWVNTNTNTFFTSSTTYDNFLLWGFRLLKGYFIMTPSEVSFGISRGTVLLNGSSLT